MKYRKKPVVIEAIKYVRDEDFIAEYEELTGSKPYMLGNKLTIGTLEGDMTASVGDYIIKGVQGEIYPCKPDIFEQTYEKVV